MLRQPCSCYRHGTFVFIPYVFLPSTSVTATATPFVPGRCRVASLALVLGWARLLVSVALQPAPQLVPRTPSCYSCTCTAFLLDLVVRVRTVDMLGAKITPGTRCNSTSSSTMTHNGGGGYQEERIEATQADYTLISLRKYSPRNFNECCRTCTTRIGVLGMPSHPGRRV